MIINTIEAEQVQVALMNENKIFNFLPINKQLLNNKEFEKLYIKNKISKDKFFCIYFFHILEQVELIGWSVFIELNGDKTKPIYSIKMINEKIQFLNILLKEFGTEKPQEEYFFELIKKMDFEINLNKESKKIISKKQSFMLEEIDQYWYSNKLSPIKREIAEYILKNKLLKESTLKKEFSKYYITKNIKSF